MDFLEMSDVADKSDLETIVIMGTNDIHGALEPQSLSTRETDGKAPILYQAGGAAYLASYVKTLQKQFGNRFIWLDGGDQFQGSIESNIEKGAAMVRFFNHLGLKAAVIGNHEFDFGAEIPGSADTLGALKARVNEAKYPYLSANLLDKATQARPADLHSTPHSILDVGRVKVGIIGLTTPETATTTMPTYIRSLEFAELKKTTLREAKALRNQGADLVVILAHSGLKCGPGKTPAHQIIWKSSDPLGRCDSKSELVQLLRELPERTVDAVVSGHSHSIIHHWVSGVPVIQAGASGRYFNLIYLPYDLGQKRLLQDRVRIEGPIPVCPLVFKNQNDCNGDRPAPKNGRGSLVPPRFHNEVVEADVGTQETLRSSFEKSALIKNEIIGQAARKIEHQRTRESELGNLVADAIRSAAQSDVALMNSGGIRAPLQAGPISYGDVFRSLPFDNSIVVLSVTGRELKTILRVAQSGSRGFPSISGLRLRLIDPRFDAPSNDLNQDGRIEPWEINRLISAKFENGAPILDDRIYTLATIDFLLLGGDDMKWPLSRIPAQRVNMGDGTPMREAVVRFIRHIRNSGGLEWNSVYQPLINSADPRLQFENPKAKKAKKGKKAKSKQKRRRKR